MRLPHPRAEILMDDLRWLKESSLLAKVCLSSGIMLTLDSRVYLLTIAGAGSLARFRPVAGPDSL